MDTDSPCDLHPRQRRGATGSAYEDHIFSLTQGRQDFNMLARAIRRHGEGCQVNALNENPLVSVIMPAYNARAYIGQAIQSIVEQDYENWELIVVDDGSSDGTPEEAMCFGPRVIVIKQKNGGPAAARNKGAAAARGELLAFLDADDVWLPGKLSSQVRYLRDHPETGIVFGQWIRWNANADGSFSAPPTVTNHSDHETIADVSGWIYPELLLDSVVWIVSAMLRKHIWKELCGLDETLRIGEDYDFFLRASRRCRIDKLRRTLALYRIHNQSTTHVVRLENYEAKVILRALDNFGPYGPDGRRTPPDVLRARLFGLFFDHGYRHFHHGDARVAAAAFRQALIHSRRCSAKAIGYLVASWLRSVRLSR